MQRDKFRYRNVIVFSIIPTAKTKKNICRETDLTNIYDKVKWFWKKQFEFQKNRIHKFKIYVYAYAYVIYYNT